MVLRLRYAPFSGLRMRSTSLNMNIQYFRKGYEVTGHELPLVADAPFLPRKIWYHASRDCACAVVTFSCEGEGGRRRLDVRPDPSTRARALSSRHNTRLCSRSDYLEPERGLYPFIRIMWTLWSCWL